MAAPCSPWMACSPARNTVRAWPLNSIVSHHVKRRRKWLRTDEREDAVRSLEWSAQVARSLKESPQNWKWLLISLHNTVQGYMVVALEKGNGLLALRPRIARKWIEAFEGRGPYPVEKLDDFMPLYEKVKDPKHFSKPFPARAAHDKRIERLHALRGQFMHFTPCGWSVELAGLPDMVAAGSEIATWCISDADAAWYKASHIKRTKAAVRVLVRASREA